MEESKTRQDEYLRNRYQTKYLMNVENEMYSTKVLDISVLSLGIIGIILTMILSDHNDYDKGTMIIFFTSILSRFFSLYLSIRTARNDKNYYTQMLKSKCGFDDFKTIPQLKKIEYLRVISEVTSYVLLYIGYLLMLLN